MFQILTAVIAISVCVLSIWAPRSAWIAFGVVDTCFLSQLVVVRKLYRIDHLVSVSPEAKGLVPRCRALVDTLTGEGETPAPVLTPR